MKEGNLTQKEAAEFLGMSESFIKKARKEFDLPYFKLGKSVRFRKEDLIKWQKLRKVS